jgi:hypothetical protein
MTDLLTPAESAAIARVSVRTLKRLSDAGMLPCVSLARPGARCGRIFYRRTDLLNLLSAA